ncbi:hypothetical protein CCH79_00019833 [Gambusia affinis]|uniref:Receptor ligand binding region domain-containing protein n=1 Tax=Gambusia affinis TaxID=33528 RepID=A0A315W092_GAMAF|nr:hypothetical protein CCH79_00019833 [Gambusia affinis]
MFWRKEAGTLLMVLLVLLDLSGGREPGRPGLRRRHARDQERRRPRQNITLADRNGICSESVASLAAVDLKLARDPWAFIGPGCSYAAAPVGLFTAHWDVPMITAGAMAVAFYNGVYPSITNTGPTHKKLGRFGLQVCLESEWREHVALVFSDHKYDDRPCYFAIEGLYEELKASNISTHHSVFEEKEIDFAQILADIQNSGRGESHFLFPPQAHPPPAAEAGNAIQINASAEWKHYSCREADPAGSCWVGPVPGELSRSSGKFSGSTSGTNQNTAVRVEPGSAGSNRPGSDPVLTGRRQENVSCFLWSGGGPACCRLVESSCHLEGLLGCSIVFVASLPRRPASGSQAVGEQVDEEEDVLLVRKVGPPEVDQQLPEDVSGAADEHHWRRKRRRRKLLTRSLNRPEPEPSGSGPIDPTKINSCCSDYRLSRTYTGELTDRSAVSRSHTHTGHTHTRPRAAAGNQVMEEFGPVPGSFLRVRTNQNSSRPGRPCLGTEERDEEIPADLIRQRSGGSLTRVWSNRERETVSVKSSTVAGSTLKPDSGQGTTPEPQYSGSNPTEPVIQLLSVSLAAPAGGSGYISSACPGFPCSRPVCPATAAVPFCDWLLSAPAKLSWIATGSGSAAAPPAGPDWLSSGGTDESERAAEPAPSSAGLEKFGSSSSADGRRLNGLKLGRTIRLRDTSAGLRSFTGRLLDEGAELLQLSQEGPERRQNHSKAQNQNQNLVRIISHNYQDETTRRTGTSAFRKSSSWSRNTSDQNQRTHLTRCVSPAAPRFVAAPGSEPSTLLP